MKEKKIPEHYKSLQNRFPKVMSALEDLGKSVKASGPLDEKTVHLMQLAAASAIQSEGSVHSHTRRALESGASPEEIYHSVLVLVSTVGFPKIAAAISWVDDIIQK